MTAIVAAALVFVAVSALVLALTARAPSRRLEQRLASLSASGSVCGGFMCLRSTSRSRFKNICLPAGILSPASWVNLLMLFLLSKESAPIGIVGQRMQFIRIFMPFKTVILS